MKPTEGLPSFSSPTINTDPFPYQPLHDCMYHHTWQAILTPDGQYRNPAARFCVECLENHRITVGSVLIKATLPAVVTLLFLCRRCHSQQLYPLIPDPRNALIEDLTEVDYTVKVDRWFHLPERWPHCDHCHASFLPYEDAR